MNGTNLLSLVTSMFLHADILHLGLNMFFLLVSGNAVERELGNFHFLGLYLGFGVIAGQFHSYLNSKSVIPTIGASGAIFGVLAAFAILFPFRWLLKTLRIHSHSHSHASHTISIHNNSNRNRVCVLRNRRKHRSHCPFWRLPSRSLSNTTIHTK